MYNQPEFGVMEGYTNYKSPGGGSDGCYSGFQKDKEQEQARWTAKAKHV